MLYHTILYCTILYYAILYYTILYYAILYYTILYCITFIFHFYQSSPLSSSQLVGFWMNITFISLLLTIDTSAISFYFLPLFLTSFFFRFILFSVLFSFFLFFCSYRLSLLEVGEVMEEEWWTEWWVSCWQRSMDCPHAKQVSLGMENK